MVLDQARCLQSPALCRIDQNRLALVEYRSGNGPAHMNRLVWSTSSVQPKHRSKLRVSRFSPYVREKNGASFGGHHLEKKLEQRLLQLFDSANGINRRGNL